MDHITVTIRCLGTVAVTECSSMDNGVVTIVRQEFETRHTAPATLYDTEAHNEAIQ